MGEIYAFIDSQNLNLAIRDINWELDFSRFKVYLKDKYNVKKAFLFIGYLKNNEKLYDYLKKSGYEIIFKPTIENKGQIKGNCDAELVLHSMIQYENFEKAIIISGDGDFHYLIEYLEEKNKLLKVGIPNKYKYSALLRRFKPYFFYICELKDKLEYKKRQRVDKD